MAIKSFADIGSRDIAEGVNSRHARALVPQHLHPKALELCSVLSAARRLDDLTLSPSWRLEKLKGNRLGQYSIRINRQYRICFTWMGQDAEDVEIVDYH